MPFCSQGAISPARRFAKAEVRGTSPRESASFKAPVPQQQQGEFRKLVFVGASPTRGSNFKSGSWCNSSISPCEGDGPGANPGFLTNYRSRTPKRQQCGRRRKSPLVLFISIPLAEQPRRRFAKP